MNPSEVLEQVQAAVEARIASTGLRVGSSRTYPCVAVYVSSPLAPTEDYGDSRSRLAFQINTVVVGVDEGQCRATLGRVIDALYRWRPQVGVRSWRVEHPASSPPSKDDSLPDRVVWSARDVWSLSVIR